jgi:hypothetical protein
MAEEKTQGGHELPELTDEQMEQVSGGVGGFAAEESLLKAQKVTPTFKVSDVTLKRGIF